MASALREHVLQYMHLGGYSPKTVKSYIRAYEALARFYWKALDYLSCQQVQNYLDYLITEKKLAWATVNVYFRLFVNYHGDSSSLPQKNRIEIR